MSEKLEKEVLSEVLTPAMVNEIWSANYTEALAFTLQDFSVGALLPAMFYMFRRGHRRGQGNFAERFVPFPCETEFAKTSTKKAATVASVARLLAEDTQQFAGFENSTAQNILADFLLTHCLENQRHEPGRKKPIIRAFPTHYQSAWMDLPASVGNLRQVPETLVAILVNQKSGESLAKDVDKSFFGLQSGFHENILLSAFAKGMSTRALTSDLIDEFDETVDLGLDQLATVRVARKCQQPTKLQGRGGIKSKKPGRGSSEIANQHALSKRAASTFRDDV